MDNFEIWRIQELYNERKPEYVRLYDKLHTKELANIQANNYIKNLKDTHLICPCIDIIFIISNKDNIEDIYLSGNTSNIFNNLTKYIKYELWRISSDICEGTDNIVYERIANNLKRPRSVSVKKGLD